MGVSLAPSKGVRSLLSVFSILFVLAGFEAQAQRIIKVKEGNNTVTYEVVREIGRGGMGNIYKVRKEGTQDYFAIKVFKTSMRGDLLRENIAAYKRVSEILKAGANPEYLMDVSVFQASVDFGPLETIFRMPIYEQPGMQQLPDIRRVGSEQDLEAKVADLHDIWKSGVLGVLELAKFGLRHNDVKFSNMLRRNHYVLGDYDTVTLATASVRGGTVANVPADFGIRSNPSLEGDLYGVAVAVAEQLTGQSFHIFESWEEVGRINSEAKVRQRLQEFNDYIESVIANYPAELTESRRVLESMVSFVRGFLQFNREARERAALELLNDPNFDASMKRDLAPIRRLIGTMDSDIVEQTLVHVRSERPGSCERPMLGQ